MGLDTFGGRLKAARDELGLRQEDVGKGLGTGGKDVGKQVVAGWEKDKHHPRADQLALICKRLNKSADYLLTGVNNALISPEAAQLASEIDAFQDEQRRHIIRICKETIQFVQRRNGGALTGQDQAARQ